MSFIGRKKVQYALLGALAFGTAGVLKMNLAPNLFGPSTEARQVHSTPAPATPVPVQRDSALEAAVRDSIFDTILSDTLHAREQTQLCYRLIDPMMSAPDYIRDECNRFLSYANKRSQ